MADLMEHPELIQKVPALLHLTSRVLASWLGHTLPKIVPDGWWQALVVQRLSSSQNRRIHEKGLTSLEQLDLAALLRVLDSNWHSLSQVVRLGIEQRNYAKEMFAIRNRWAHLGAGSDLDADDVYRDVDTLQRFLQCLKTDTSILDEVNAFKQQIRAGAMSEQNRKEPEQGKRDDPAPRQGATISESRRDLQPGTLVCLKNDTSRKGALMSISHVGSDPKCQVFLDGLPQEFYLSQIQGVPVTTTDTVITLDELHCLLTAIQVRHPSSLTLHSLNAARIDFVPYQFRPALKLIRADRPRLLIADGVGVGKTIEAGLILRELQARQNVESVLVICPKPLVAERKWEREMRRFDERFTQLDGKSLRYCISEMDLDGEWPDRHKKTIIPYSLFDSRSLGGAEFRSRKELGLLDLDPPPKFDLVIVDEAHHVRNRSTLAHQAVRFFTDHAEAVVFLTATPIQMANTDLYVLLNLLRPDLVIDENTFASMAEPNPHINAALREARAGRECWWDKAFTSLTAAAATPWGQTALKHAVEFKRVQQRLSHGDFSREERVRTIHSMEGLHSFAPLISRTRRRDIGSFCTRRTETVEVPFTDAQKVLHDDLIAFERNALSLLHGTKNVGFMMSTIRRQASSCIFGLAPFLEDMLGRRLGSLVELDGIDAPDDGTFAFSDPALKQLREDAQDILEHSKALPVLDPKYEALKRIIEAKQEATDNKLMVFSTFRHTLGYLRKKLTSEGFRVALIHGDVEDLERSALRARFEQDKAGPDAMDVMLFSEVGCEGLDYQFCSTMVNYDLPWNPMRIEQRIGRIDRRGQRSDVVSIYNFVTPSTIDADVYTRCLQRINVFEANIGECENILGEIHEGVRKIAEDIALTQEERQARLEQLADNKIAELEHQRELEEREQELFGIRLPKHQADIDVEEAESDWLAGRSLQRLATGYLEDRCGKRDYFLGDRPMKTLRLSRDARSMLLDDYRALNLTRNESSRLWEKWLKGDDPHCSITFDSSSASDDRTALFVTAVHPLTLQAAHYFGQKFDTVQLNASVVDGAVAAGVYPFAIYAWEFIGVRSELQLVPVCETREVEENLFAYLEQGLPAAHDMRLLKGGERPCVLARVERCQRRAWEERREEHRETNKQICAIRRASLERSFTERIKHLETQLSETSSSRIARMRESQLARAHRELAEKLAELEAALDKTDIHIKCVAFGVLAVQSDEQGMA